MGCPEQRAGRPDNCSDADYTDLVPVSSATQPAYRAGEYHPPTHRCSRYRVPFRRS